MNIRVMLATLSAILIALPILWGCATPGDVPRAGRVLQVKILQLDENPELDEARDGIIAAIRESGPEGRGEVRIDWASAGGGRLAARQILEQMALEQPDLIVTLATPCLEQVINVTSNQPVVFGVAMNPFVLGLDRSTHPRPITGWYAEPPMDMLADLTRKIFPQAQTLGVVWNPSEINSRYDMLALRKAAQRYEFEIVETRVRNAATLQEKMTELLTLTPDVLVLFADNTVITGLEQITVLIREAHVPVVSATAVGQDLAVVTVGFDTGAWGRATGEMAAQVLAGADPAVLPLREFQDLKIVVNQGAARSLNLAVPPEVLKEADAVVE